MSKPTLTNLKSKIVQAQKDLDNILRIIDNKQPILDRLLADIKQSEKVLEDGFAQRDLELQREHLKVKEELDAEIVHVKNTVTVLREKEHDQLEVNKELEKQTEVLRLSVRDLEQIVRKTTVERDSLKLTIISLHSSETTIKNSIDKLRSDKKKLEDELSTQVMQNGTTLYEMQTKFNEEQNALESKIEIAKDELRKLQQELIVENNRTVELQEEYKRKDLDLVQRENSLIIKTKALTKERQDFETETRRWNYTKPKE